MTPPELRPAPGMFADRLRVLVVAAHPDEPDEYAGGIAARLALAGHGVKFLSLTNGDAGHWSTPRKALARRRAAEAFAAARELGVQEYEILDEHDGELVPSIALRREVVARIRRWQADLVVTFHDECPGHLDNRAAGRLVREAVSVVGLANVVPRVPALATPPVCLLMPDHDALAHHRHDVVVDVSRTIEAKLRACLAHASQFLEFAPWQRGLLDQDRPRATPWGSGRSCSSTGRRTCTPSPRCARRSPRRASTPSGSTPSRSSSPTTGGRRRRPRCAPCWGEPRARRADGAWCAPSSGRRNATA